MSTRQAYRYALDLTNVQAGACASHAGAARFAYNWGLATIKAALERGEKAPTGVDLHRQWNVWKKSPESTAPWWGEVSKCAPQEALRDLHTAMGAFWSSRAGKRKGRRVGFPTWKRKTKTTPSFRLTGAIHVTDTHVVLPRLGALRTHESTRKLRRLLRQGKARITAATVSKRGGRWYVSFAVEIDRAAVPAQRRVAASGGPTGPVVGVDLGVKTLATVATADGRVVAEVPGVKALAAAQRRLRRANKAYARTQRGSAGRRKAAARLAKIHGRVANLRTDQMHKLTTMLAKSHSVIVVEDLNTAGMVRNKRLARHISDAAFGEFRRQLEYKTTWYGSTLVVADRWYPSSKACSGCGTLDPDLTLADRTYRCGSCGLVLDRDINAAVNLARLGEGQHHVAASAAETRNARGQASAGQPVTAGGTRLGEAGTRKPPAPVTGRVA